MVLPLLPTVPPPRVPRAWQVLESLSVPLSDLLSPRLAPGRALRKEGRKERIASGIRWHVHWFTVYCVAQCLWVMGRALCWALEECVLGVWIQK